MVGLVLYELWTSDVLIWNLADIPITNN